MAEVAVAAFLDEFKALRHVTKDSPLPVTSSGETTPGADATRATAVQGVTGGKPVTTIPVPSAAASSAIKPIVATAPASQLVVKTGPGNFYGATIIAGSASGYLIAYNATAAPSADASIDPAKRLHATSVLANGTASLGEFATPDLFDAGIVLLFSTSLTSFTAPSSPAPFLRGRAL